MACITLNFSMSCGILLFLFKLPYLYINLVVKCIKMAPHFFNFYSSSLDSVEIGLFRGKVYVGIE